MRKKLNETLARWGKGDLIKILVGVMILTGLGSLILNLLRAPSMGDSFAIWWEMWLRDVSVEVAGLIAFVVILAWMLEKKEQPTAQPEAITTPEEPPTEPLSPETIRETQIIGYVERLKTTTDRAARQAILDEMKKLNLLAGANLNNLDLQGANFYDANLRETSLEGANLQSAYLIEADLRGAKLSDANLEKAELSWADLAGAVMGSTNLKGAWLLRSNLKGAFLTTTQFDTRTRLPDGSLWTETTPLERFSDPANPQFWRPEPGFFGELPRWFRRNGGN